MIDDPTYPDPEKGSTTDIQKPAPAHLHTTPSRPHDGYQEIPDLEPGPPPPKFRQRHDRNPIIAVLHFVAVILGLAAIFAFIRRRCSSLRRRADRAATREERRSRRAYRRAAKRAAWKNWWRSGLGRRKDAKRLMDYEEKRALVQQGEGRLEEAMQNEIRELRRAHGVVDELVRAEEGRGTMQRPVMVGSRMPGMASIAGVMMGRSHIPAHIYTGSSTTSSDTGSAIMTPPTSASGHSLSRSDSLPTYHTDPDSDDARSIFSDNPPAYRTDDDDDSSDEDGSSSVQVEIVTNGFRRYEPSEYTPSLLSPNSVDGASIFTPDSSIPDLSPRQSAETVRTFM